ncbi:MAG: GNAT family N-acetyltransferase [Sporolactobacillus sp.]|jgi:GNAT superfamily N-acetyltransferase|nr:GNAT family N-acetyltransferase [Sporolactobacillus sp.]
MISYRTYQPGDEKQIVALWNKCLQTDPVTITRFRNLILLDANFDPQGLQLAFDNDDLVGALFGLIRLLPMYGTNLELGNGWITFFFVSGKYRQQNIGKQLLNNCLLFFKQNACHHIYFSSYAPNYIVPGIDRDHYAEGYRFLDKHDFEIVYPCVAMDLQLINFSIPEELQKMIANKMAEGYYFRQCHAGDLYPLIQFATRDFNPDWGRAIREGILQGLPMENIWVSYYQDKLVGFCLHGGYEGVLERFGPFGVDQAYRGEKIGKILLNLCLYSMKGQGLHGAWFLWTGEKSAAGYLYKKTGFRVTRSFLVMKREI